jgi:hypothetical protein
MVLGMKSHLEEIKNAQEEMCRTHTNIVPFYARDLSVLRFWYAWGVLEPSFPLPRKLRITDCILS